MIEETMNRWETYCKSQGLHPEARAARLKMGVTEYINAVKDGSFPAPIFKRIQQIVDNREIIDRTVLPTSLLQRFEKNILRCLSDKMMITLAAPTGQGKTTVARFLSSKYNLTYFQVLSEMEKEKKASIRKFVGDLLKSTGYRQSREDLRQLINRMTSDTRTILVIDEAQRLISEDFGYLKVLQDLLDNVPNLSIMLLGNYKFYEEMMVDPNRTYSGISDTEQFLRRISLLEKLPRLTRHDVKIWGEYHGMKLSEKDHSLLSEYFSKRAALADLENIRKEIIRGMGKGSIKSWANVTGSVIIDYYRIMHTVRHTSNHDQEGMRNEEANAA